MFFFFFYEFSGGVLAELYENIHIIKTLSSNVHRSDRLDQSGPGVAFRENIIVSARYKSRVREIKKKNTKNP